MMSDHDPFDAKLDAMLRNHSTEMPSRELDHAILAAAHRAVQSAPHGTKKPAEATSPWRWWMPLAAAATIGAMTIGVFQMLPKEQPDVATTTIVTDTPPARSQPEATSPTSPRAPASVEKDRVEQPRGQSEAPRAKLRADRAAQPPADKRETRRLAAPEPFPAQRSHATSRDSVGSAPNAAEPESKPQAAPSSAEAGSKPQAVQQDNAAGTLMRREAPQAAAPAIAKQSAASADANVADPQHWIARIRALLAEGKTEDAARELMAFRAAYPDADSRLPVELQAWAATVKR